MSDTTVETEAPWYEYIDRKRRHNFLAILETLSRQQNKDTPQFFLIGAMALGLGDGAEIRMPMAVTVIAGLLSSTVLTLVVIPTAYAALESARSTRR